MTTTRRKETKMEIKKTLPLTLRIQYIRKIDHNLLSVFPNALSKARFKSGSSAAVEGKWT